MKKLTALFDVINAKSKGFSDYSSGEVPFISNGFFNNGVVGFVEPFDTDRVFNEMCICVSAFCEATVHYPPFVARGNGGSGLKVLVPKETMSYDELVEIASIINNNLKWRYSYGRMVSVKRLSKESIPYESRETKINRQELLDQLIPKSKQRYSTKHNLSFSKYPITQLFDLQHGDFHSLDALDEGAYPTVSRIDSNNGIVGFYDKPDDALIYEPLTITVSTVTGQAFVQLDNYIATDNVVICTPKQELRTTTLFYIATALNSEKWRWMYGRQCYKKKFAKTIIDIPSLDGGIDEDVIEVIVKSTWGWEMIESYLERNSRKLIHTP